MSVRVIFKSYSTSLLAIKIQFQSSDFCGPSSFPSMNMYKQCTFQCLTSSVLEDHVDQLYTRSVVFFFREANFRKISHFGDVAGAWCGEDLRRGEERLRANRAQLNKIPLVFWRWSRILNRALNNQKVLFALVFWRALGNQQVYNMWRGEASRKPSSTQQSPSRLLKSFKSNQKLFKMWASSEPIQ